MKLAIFTDGGSRGNPGAAASAFIVVDEQTGAAIHEEGQSLGTATNNEAEYRGFLSSLEWVMKHPTHLEHISWKLDSLLVVQQLNKVWKIKDERMRAYAQTAWSLLQQLSTPYSIQHVPREQNARADEVVNATLDALS